MSSIFRFVRRPSAPMIVSLVALFVALGGVGYAAFRLAPNSVGTAQLRNSAVTNHKLADASVGNHKLKTGSVGPRKIQPGAVGLTQIDTTQVQARVVGTCSGITGAIGSIGSTGSVTCNPTLPGLAETQPASPVTLTGGGDTQIASQALSGVSSFLAFAQPDVTITSSTANQSVSVTCTLADAATGESRNRTWAIESTSNATMSPETYRQTIPLITPAKQLSGGSSVTVSCSQSFTPSTTAPTVTVASGIDAIQVESIN